ncbi:MAG: N-acetylmuramoyl-L-alanine amidase [Thiovulaceae bacterium]|jgi:N-acetylmuramoyl-L-alanine amidase|nr:N-acetylmuramoyl-L-alanine amidase [Sulfurimonadaceae bacterium]
MVRFLFAFLFVTLLGLSASTNDQEILKRAAGYMKSESKSDYFRAYNDYKNLYLRAIMAEDEELKIEALRGIVKSGQKLHIDVVQYSEELIELDKTPVLTQEAPSKQPSLKSDPAKEIKLTSSNKLKAVKWRSERLVLVFDKNLKNNHVNYFALEEPAKNSYRYIFDIHASMLTESQNLRKEGLSRIKLAQFDPNTLRLVIEDDNKVTVRFKKEKNELVIYIQNKLDSRKPPIPKAAPVPEKKDTKKQFERNKTIVIDAGHGGKDPGAVGYRNYREKVIVLQVAQKLQKILKARGYKVYMTRDSDKFVKLSHRTKFANDKNADLFISIHVNAIDGNSANGIETYFLSPSRSERAKNVAAKENSADLSDMNFYGKQSLLNTLNSHNIVASNKLAIDLQQGMLQESRKLYKDVRDAGVREGPFWVLVGALMPSVLVEIGFVSNPKEAKRLVKEKYQNSLASGMADGIDRYFYNNGH